MPLVGSKCRSWLPSVVWLILLAFVMSTFAPLSSATVNCEPLYSRRAPKIPTSSAASSDTSVRTSENTSFTKNQTGRRLARRAGAAHSGRGAKVGGGGRGEERGGRRSRARWPSRWRTEPGSGSLGKGQGIRSPSPGGDWRRKVFAAASRVSSVAIPGLGVSVSGLVGAGVGRYWVRGVDG